MTKSDIQSILGAKTVSYNSLFAKAIRNVPAAVFLSQAIFWQEKAKFKNALDTIEIDGEVYFAKTGAEWFDETGLTSEQQKTARKCLCALAILKEKRAGVPAKMYFRIDIESLVSGISAYLNTGLSVSGFSANRLTENPRTSSGKFRKQEDGISANSNNIESFESLDSEGENKTALSPSENKTLEVEKEKKAPPVAPAPPAGTRLEIYDPEAPDAAILDIVSSEPQTQPPLQRIELGSRATAETPMQLQQQILAFYNDPNWQREWLDGVWRINGVWIPDNAEKQKKLENILLDFCCHTVKKNGGRDTYRELNAGFQQWVRNEKNAFWKQKTAPGQAGQKAVYTQPDLPIYTTK